MKSISLLFVLFAFFDNGYAHAAGSALRIACDGDAANAEVYINDKFKGECPLDVQVQEGQLKLRVQKKTDAEHEPRLFEQEIRMGEGVVKKVEVHLGAAELNSEGRKREEERRAEAKRREAEEIANREMEFRKACPGCIPEMIAIPGRNHEMGKYEVTQGQWRAIMGNNPSRFSHCGDNCPVELVSWNDIEEYITKLNHKTGKQYRLPTEAEWEYACYGGSQTEYCGSNDINAVAWFGDEVGLSGTKGNSGKQTHPVGQKQANGYGLYDMSGNVWEWVEDCWKGDCAVRVLRGGSFLNSPQNSRAAFRLGNDAAFRLIYLGFRLARTLP